MIRRAGFVTLLIAAVLAGGCGGDDEQAGDQTGAPGRVAVIDLNRIVTDLGKQEEIEQRVQEYADSLSEPLQELEQDLNERIQALQEAVEGEPTEQQQQELQRINQDRRRLQVAVAQARQQVNLARQQLYAAFAEQVRPVARRIAEQRGMTLVVPSTAVQWYASEVSITDEVVDEIHALMRRGTFTLTVPPAEAATQPADG
jgi:Skp family chaperone for outer membrane proteins